ncbi:MAG: hypothetical protein WCR66_08545 [Bacteroidota bacterium]
MIIYVQKRSFLLTYLRLGYLLHIMTIAEIFLIISWLNTFDVVNWMQNEFVVLKSAFLLIIVSAPIFPQFDARSRYQNYKQVKDHLFMYGFQPRIIKPFSNSRCQRDAVIAAAEELGMENECANYFIQKGHRWYHILPDFLFQKPAYLFQKAFWLNTFFVKYYHSKIDFAGVVKKQNSNARSEEPINFSSRSLSN